MGNQLPVGAFHQPKSTLHKRVTSTVAKNVSLSQFCNYDVIIYHGKSSIKRRNYIPNPSSLQPKKSSFNAAHTLDNDSITMSITMSIHVNVS